MTSASNPFARLPVVGVLVLALAGGVVGPVARAAEYFVNAASPSCSNTGPGTEATPYCTITAALVAHHTPGTIITVMPGTYREQVTVSWSGTSSAPIVVRAQPAPLPALVDGTDDYSSPALWTHFFGDVWLASSVTWNPRQVFADDARLAPSVAEPFFLPARSFRYVAGTGLYVHAGGGNPGAHATQIGRRLYGFFVSGRSNVKIEGFRVQRTEERCIQVQNSHTVEVVGNHLRSAGRFGLQAQGDSAVRIASNVLWDHQGHGISLTAFTAASIVEDNESYGNADPAVRSANGLYMFSASRNVVRRNRWHHNQDTGQHMGSGANDNVSIANRSWSNGDHGFDHVGATGTTHVNDVSYGNFNDGFSFEGGSIDSEIRNVISIENGATTQRFNLFVDTTSTVGFDSDDNVFWNSGPRAPVRYANSVYASVAWYSEMRDHDDRSLQMDPQFVAPPLGDFHLQAHSPAIDNANTEIPEWSATDAEGLPASNDPGMPDVGLGPVSFADRGALEFQGTSALPNQPPTAQLQLSHTTGVAPLLVRADASGSNDPDGGPLTYVFDLGEGTVLGPQSWPFVDHIHGAGTHVVQVTVTDAGGASATASVTVVVAPETANLVGNPSFEPGLTGWAATSGASLVHVPGGRAGSWAARVNAPNSDAPAYGITDAPRWVENVPLAGSVHHVRAWVKSASGSGSIALRIRETLGNVSGPWSVSPSVALSESWSELALDYTTLFRGSRLAIEIVNQSFDWGSAFLVDDVSVVREPGTGAPGDDRGPARAGDPGGPAFALPRPNPVRGDGAWFRLTTTRPGAVAIHVFDLAGRRVRALSSTAADAGPHAIHFDGRGEDGSRLAAGVYHYQVRSPHGVRAGRLVLTE